MAKLKEQISWENFNKSVESEKIKFLRVENIGSSTPDVIGQNRNGAVFWIENKALKTWPMRTRTKVLANAFEPGQVPFLRSWRQWGGHAYVLLRVSSLEYYLIDPISNEGDPRELIKSQIVEKSLARGKFNIIDYLESLK